MRREEIASHCNIRNGMNAENSDVRFSFMSVILKL